MENMNKILSFILGLVVVVFLIIFVSGKFKEQKQTLAPQESAITTITPSVKPTGKVVLNARNLRTIPNTGIPILLFPALGASFLSGVFLKKTGKKE